MYTGNLLDLEKEANVNWHIQVYLSLMSPSREKDMFHILKVELSNLYLHDEKQ